jgi:hypothetical protein
MIDVRLEHRHSTEELDFLSKTDRDWIMGRDSRPAVVGLAWPGSDVSEDMSAAAYQKSDGKDRQYSNEKAPVLPGPHSTGHANNAQPQQIAISATNGANGANGANATLLQRASPSWSTRRSLCPRYREHRSRRDSRTKPQPRPRQSSHEPDRDRAYPT